MCTTISCFSGYLHPHESTTHRIRPSPDLPRKEEEIYFAIKPTKLMKILLTGANGYIGKRLLQQLVHEGHEVWCVVREPHRFAVSDSIRPRIHVLQVDFLEPEDACFPPDMDAAYYLIHSMTGTKSGF
jgi:hypothetical protein